MAVVALDCVNARNLRDVSCVFVFPSGLILIKRREKARPKARFHHALVADASQAPGFRVLLFDYLSVDLNPGVAHSHQRETPGLVKKWNPACVSFNLCWSWKAAKCLSRCTAWQPRKAIRFDIESSAGAQVMFRQGRQQ